MKFLFRFSVFIYILLQTCQIHCFCLLDLVHVQLVNVTYEYVMLNLLHHLKSALEYYGLFGTFLLSKMYLFKQLFHLKTFMNSRRNSSCFMCKYKKKICKEINVILLTVLI